MAAFRPLAIGGHAMTVWSQTWVHQTQLFRNYKSKPIP